MRGCILASYLVRELAYPGLLLRVLLRSCHCAQFVWRLLPRRDKGCTEHRALHYCVPCPLVSAEGNIERHAPHGRSHAQVPGTSTSPIVGASLPEPADGFCPRPSGSSGTTIILAAEQKSGQSATTIYRRPVSLPFLHCGGVAADMPQDCPFGTSKARRCRVG